MKFEEITFNEAMEMVANGDLNNLYFERAGDIVCAKTYRIDVKALAKQKWFKREVTENE